MPCTAAVCTAVHVGYACVCVCFVPSVMSSSVYTVRCAGCLRAGRYLVCASIVFPPLDPESLPCRALWHVCVRLAAMNQVTVVTGFLGAGKTTLVNYILKEQVKCLSLMYAPYDTSNCVLLVCYCCIVIYALEFIQEHERPACFQQPTLTWNKAAFFSPLMCGCSSFYA